MFNKFSRYVNFVSLNDAIFKDWICPKIFSILFEVFSAMGTVGMGIGITPDWNPWCKLVLIMTMYIGRIGILTFGMSFFNKKVDKLRYPTENVMIG